MKWKLLTGFVAVVGAQLLLLMGMIGFNEYTLQTGASAFSSATLIFYVVDSQNLLLLDSDAVRVLTGALQKQY